MAEPARQNPSPEQSLTDLSVPDSQRSEVNFETKIAHFPLSFVLTQAIKQGVSDVKIKAGAPLQFKVHGEYRTFDSDVSYEQVLAAIKMIATPNQFEQFLEHGDVDIGLSFKDARFRIVAYKERNGCGMIMRMLPNSTLSWKQLGVPPAVVEESKKKRGLILVTGPTGSGKTTTLAALTRNMIEEGHRHIVTIEEPVEHLFDHPMVTQMEVGKGKDVPSFHRGLRRALRMAPEVILVGEMRDRETIKTALTAAETGHLVLSTLHTRTADGAITRITDVFEGEQQEVRKQLADALLAVVCQSLLPRKDGPGRIAAYEVMRVSDAIRSAITNGKIQQIKSYMQTGKREGNVLRDDYLLLLVKKGLVDEEEALAVASRPNALKDKFRS